LESLKAKANKEAAKYKLKQQANKKENVEETVQEIPV